MRIDSSFDEGVAFLAVSGDVDVDTADELQEAGVAALTAACGTLRIDLAGVTFMDSTGLAGCYLVRAVDKHGNQSHLTNQVCIDDCPN